MPEIPARPLPRINEDTRPFWEGCKAHELRFQKCQDCGLVRWPPSVVCPHCLSGDTVWINASGRGTVYTFAVFRRAFHEAFQANIPYVTASIQLEEGPRILSNVVGCPPAQVACDMPVEVTWEDITEVFSLPKFKTLERKGSQNIKKRIPLRNQ